MEKRFVRTLSQGVFGTMEIWVDTQTGVNYLFRQNGYAGGMTVLLDREGKPVISPCRCRKPDKQIPPPLKRRGVCLRREKRSIDNSPKLPISVSLPSTRRRGRLRRGR